MNKITIYVLLACLWTVSAVQAQSFGSPAMRKLQMAEFAISNFYVDKVDEDKLVEEAIIKMLAQLDPHSTYSDAEEVKKMNEPLQGNFEGIGVQFQMIEDTLLVVQPVSNGPSEKIGILAGDRQRQRHCRCKDEYGRNHEASSRSERLESKPENCPSRRPRPVGVHRKKRQDTYPQP